MATNFDSSLPSTRTRPAPTNTIMSRPGGLFGGLVLLIVGGLWFLDAAGIINVGPNFGLLAPPFLVMLAGLYLVVTKLVRR